MKTASRAAGGLITSLALALTAASADERPALSKEEIASRLNGVQPDDISESPVDGIYQVAVGADVAYVTEDGRYVLQGDIYDLETRQNVTEKTRARARVSAIASVDRDHMIVFSPKDGNVKHTITIFTDIDCGYCRQFHRDIDKVNALGIEVHYLFYPRTGPNTESWEKAEKVWCVGPEKRNEALTRAKLGGSVPDKTCEDTPVDEHFELGRLVGVRGTPAIFDENGELLGGYLSPATLAKVLDGDQG
ncbi:MAG TPA: DsbC family protein [Gammaproteobacteria bacterium]